MSGGAMRCFFYQAKIVVKEYKTDEFTECVRFLLPVFRKEKGCLEYSLCRDIEKENTYSVVGEWKTRKAMEKHFQTHDFEVLIGAARVLGDAFEMIITEVKEKGGYKLAMSGFKTPPGAPSAQ
jgi:quinol monooxygenase YgiN